MPVLTIIRGVSGSGKSTVAKAIAVATRADHVEADMYLIDEDGQYRFDGTKIKQAHQHCKETTEYAMQQGGHVIVSNTFTQRWEVQPYLDLAERYGYRVQIIECRGDFGNVHGVPDDVIARMRDRWESVDLPD